MKKTIPLLTTTLFFGQRVLKITGLTIGIMVFTFSLSAQIWPPENIQGDGTESNPWQITTPEELASLADYVNAGNGYNTAGKYYKLMNHIDLNEYENWKPIGGRLMSSWATAFQGNFDGNEKIIQNLTINRPTENHIGLFGEISYAVIENIGVDKCNILGKGYVGGLVGRSRYSIIRNCYVTGDVEVTTGILTQYAGGLVGLTEYPTITNCYAACNVKGFCNVGGLAGTVYGQGSTISTSFSAGTVTADFGICGGLIGDITNWGGGAIRNCVAVNASVRGGGTDIGRIAGYSYPLGGCHNNYAMNTMVVQNNSGNITIIDGLNTTDGMGIEMELIQSIDFYAAPGNWLNEAWDITSPASVWKICDDAGLPFLRWQNIGCNFTLTATAGNNGTVYPSGVIVVEEHNDTTFTFTPNMGYVITEVLVDGVSVSEAVESGSYTFSNVQNNHTIHIVFGSVGIVDLELSSIKVYPNPTTGELTITSIPRWRGQRVEELTINNVEVFDVYGRKLHSLMSLETTINIAHLPAGLYFIKITTDTGTVTKKIIKH